MPKKTAPPEEQTAPVENPDDNQIEPTEPDANQSEPDAEHYTTPEELVAAFLTSPEYTETIRVLNDKLDKIDEIIRGIINHDNPPAQIIREPDERKLKYL